ncbi:MAG TPA: biotin--[acetyl-CoA-carboxylase] ligase [Acidimicrobiales bacterium]|nr:biotin--[acetyl-CoA-carboxylase] ligase [Acidimicrobiales bacterium]
MSEGGARRRSGSTRFADVRRHLSVSSTNDVAARLARADAPEGVVVVADHQTAGRARWGRSWTAPPGSSLLVSVVLRPGPDPDALALVPLATGMAAVDACLDVAGFAPGLKWPNDLVVDGAKLGGILAELVPAPDGAPPAVVVGVGVNLRWPADGAGELNGLRGDGEGGAAVAAAEEVAGRPLARDAVLDAFLAALERRYEALEDPRSLEAFLEQYRRRCVTLGQAVRVELPGGEWVEGQAVDVEPDGRLTLREADGTVRLVAAGDVIHLRRRKEGRGPDDR